MSPLDPYQAAAVGHGDGPAIVLAGPGSGKTSVIVERAVRLIDEGVARPEQLLVLTFSRKAASDLRQRLADRLRRSYASFPVTTFHAFCLSILARAAEEPPQLARPAERRAAMREALEAENNLGYPAGSRALVDESLAFSALCDDYLALPEHALARVRTRYVEQLDSEGHIDYGGLQREAVALLQASEELRSAYAEQFRYVLVDEYQDTNVAQETLLRLVAGEHRNVFCVADEDQSIYGFRGAEIENALGFEQRWPGPTRYDLPTNYRSAPRIVEAATSVIRLNLDTHREKPLTAAHERPAQLAGQTFRHVPEEADWIAREIAALRRDDTELGEIAILARSLKQLGPPLAYALRKHAIPFHAPLSPRLHPTADALLSLIELAQPERWDAAQAEQAFDVLASPLFGADPLELRRFRRVERTVYGELRETGEYGRFFEALAIAKHQRSAGAAVYALWERLPYFCDLQERCRPLDAPREDIEELEAVTALSETANEFDDGLTSFAARFRAGELASEEWLPAETLPRDAVALLTIHQAKGLEWEAVFICDLVEGRFPALARSQYSLFDRDSFGESPQDEASRARRALEEERRIFYVALTRARSRLFLTATEETREEASRALSRFYGETEAFLEPLLERDSFVSVEEAVVALRRAGGGPPGWREIAQTENANAMLADGGLYTSASGLDPYENCPWQFYLGTLLELVRPRGAALVFGGIVHDALEAFHNPERPQPQTLERLLELGEEKWRPGMIAPAPLEEEHRRRLRRMLEDYHRYEVAAGPAPEVLAVERYFRFPLDASTISGRIDRIDRRPDGALRLVDYKSGKAMGAAEAEQDLQLALYALACAVEPELAALGTVAEIEYVFPRHIARGTVARRSQTVTPELAERTRERVRELITHIVSERFEFSPEADCKFCDFQRICPRHYGGDVPL